VSFSGEPMRTVISVIAIIAAFAAAASLLMSCGGGSTPVASVTPTAAPTPVPTATPWVCPLGKGTGTGECPQHRRADPVIFRGVFDAVNYVLSANPEWFVFEASGVVRVHGENREQFFQATVQRLNDTGFCALQDDHGKEGDGLEIAVKNTNAFSEQYKPWVTGGPQGGLDLGKIRTDATMKIATCTPAWF
jgi:hypothetical protein